VTPRTCRAARAAWVTAFVGARAARLAGGRAVAAALLTRAGESRRLEASLRVLFR
jgi:hypothetical protein